MAVPKKSRKNNEPLFFVGSGFIQKEIFFVNSFKVLDENISEKQERMVNLLLDKRWHFCYR